MREPRRHRSLRLQSYDYSWPGGYFVTICVADRMPRFGAVVDRLLRLNTMSEQRSETLSSVVHAFKSLTTSAHANGVRSHGWPEFDRRLWQQGFYDHVIRDERDLDRVRAYIDANPEHWHQDREYDVWQRSQTGSAHAA